MFLFFNDLSSIFYNMAKKHQYFSEIKVYQRIKRQVNILDTTITTSIYFTIIFDKLLILNDYVR